MQVGSRRFRLTGAFAALVLCAPVVVALADPAGAATAPDTVIDTAPTAAWKSTTAAFTFHATGQGTATPTFTCKLDAGSTGSCTSGKTYTGLAQGSHKVTITAKANGLNDPSPATVTFVVDTTKPTVPTSLALTAPTATSVKLTWKASTDTAGVTGYAIVRDGAALTSVANVLTYTDTTVLSGTTHSYAVQAFDAAGNVSALTTAKSITLPVAPDTLIDTAPAALVKVTTASFTFHSTGAGATFTCKLDAAAAAACTSPKNYTALADGSHTFTVTSTVSGVADPSPATSTFIVDTVAPTVPTGLTGTPTSATTATISWAASTDANGIAGYDVLRNGVVVASLGAVTTFNDAALTLGTTYQYAVRARDNATNVSVATAAASVTTFAAPDTVIDTAPPALTKNTSAVFTFHATGSNAGTATFSCKLDAAAPAACTSPATFPVTTDGAHTVTVAASTTDGTDPTPATATFTLDATAPSVPTGLTAVTTDTIHLSWTASTDVSGIAGYDVYRDGVLLAGLGSVTTYADTTAAPATSYQYTVAARDLAGNASAQSAPTSGATAAPFNAHLTRAPYLTDLVGKNVIVNFGTDRTAGNGTVSWGAVSGGTCSLANTAAATATVIAVNGTFEYQWKAKLTLPATGTYCYRVLQNGTDLLGTNLPPQFQTQVPVGSTEPFTFAVFGDWGQVDANGANVDQANLMSQIAASGARFAITTGDNGYPGGSQGNYGDLQQVTADTSAIFGAKFWANVGKSIPIFPIIGNHGLARTDAVHPHLVNWPQDTAVATSNGSYTSANYPSVNGSTATNYPSPWYAFDAGGARFYLLDAAWADLNTGTGTAYGNEAASHWSPTSPEYLWLKNDLAAHPSGLKFAFFHYPLYSDQPAETGDTALQGASSLEGLLGSYGVNMGFSGHAHIYQRNAAAPGGLISYVTGGGGAWAQSTGACGALDQYALGWSFTNNAGTKCGAAPKVPATASEVYHFLKITISGTQVTVTPINSTGNTFDVQSYNFPNAAHTYIDSDPGAGTTSSTATFTFHSSSPGATYTCSVDAGSASACTSPVTYAGLAQGAHTFSVLGSSGGTPEPQAATWTWTIDSSPPSAPTSLTATATSPFDVAVSWPAGADNLGVLGYNLYRDNTLLATLGNVTSFTDTTVLGGTTHQYTVQTIDVSNELSGMSPAAVVTTPPAPAPVFADGFETGDLSAWTVTAGLVVEGTTVHTGTKGAEGNTTTGVTYAKKNLPVTYADGFARIWFDAVSQTSQLNLVRLRDAAGNSIGYAFLRATGELAFHNDATNTDLFTGLFPGPGWHSLELHVKTGAAGLLELWIDNKLVPDFATSDTTGPINLGAAPIGQFQIGEVQAGARTYDVVFDDVAFGSARLGAAADAAAPTVPAGLTATAAGPFTVNLAWTASTDDTGVTGYDILRDATLVGSVGAVTTYSDTTALPGVTYQYTVRAKDGFGNTSAPSTAAPVTMPAATPPTFADGFESNSFSAWTISGGIVPETTTVHSGTYAAEGAATAGNVYVRKNLTTPVADLYTRAWFDILSQTGQVNLLRLRDAAGASIGYVYVTAAGKLAFHNDSTTLNTLSTTASVTPGWHAVELHLGLAGTTTSTVEVWLDGLRVADLSSAAANLGAFTTVGQFQLGESGTTGVFDVAFDDAAYGSARIGPVGDTTAPSVPGGVTAAAAGPFTVNVGWTASTDNTAVAGYDVFRDGTLLASVGAVTTYADTTVLASTTHQYAVRAKDSAGNVSAQSAPAPVTLPAAPAPTFADGFETGSASAWTANAGLTFPNTGAHSGTYAADANPAGTANTYVRKNLTTAVTDLYSRLWFNPVTLGGQSNLLRFRDAAGGSIGYVFVTAAGKLGFRNDNAATTVNSLTATTAAGSGWHALELHIALATNTVEVWLDGAKVTDLSGTSAFTATNIGQFQVGETATGTYHVLYDDAAYGSARLGPVGDTTPPTVPSAVSATAFGSFAVDVAWVASTDDTGVVGYDVFRDGTLLTSLGLVTTYRDSTVVASSTHTYSVRAKDTVGNFSAQSAPVSITLPAPPTPVFFDGFESNNFNAWTASAGLTTQSTTAHTGTYGADANPANTANSYARKNLTTPVPDAYTRLWFNVAAQTSQLNLLRLRDAAGASIGYVYLTTAGKLSFHNDTANTNVSSATATVLPGTGTWHAVELHVGLAGATSTVEVWLDGALVADISGVNNLAATTVGQFQIGETAAGTYKVDYDDAAIGTSRLGATGDSSAPSVPTNLTATAADSVTVNLGWTASTDDTGVAAYDVYRDGALLVSLGAVTTYTDSTVLAGSTHQYAVRARDAAGNASAQTAPVSVTTPGAATLVFSDGFEAGNLTAWSSNGGLLVQTAAAHTGTYGAQANTTATGAYAKRTLASTYLDGYVRTYFNVTARTSQLNFLRLRDSAGTSIGYLFINTSGKLGFRNDAGAVTVTSATAGVAAGSGWHSAELHVGISGAGTSAYEVWLDGVKVADLSSPTASYGAITNIGALQVGEVNTGTYTVAYDDAAFGTAHIGL